MKPMLYQFCKEHGLYLDTKGVRPSVRSGKKVIWEDAYGNKHDLDFVIEKAANQEIHRKPVAFIEIAWRRYTKHSRNKAQEIQSAILPIADRYQEDKPFLGVVLGGLFTQGSLRQLRSVGFHILHFSYTSITQAFDTVGINSRFDESTPHQQFRQCIDRIDAMSEIDKDNLRSSLIQQNEDSIAKFFRRLSDHIGRTVELLIVIPLFGVEHKFTSLESAIQFLSASQEDSQHVIFQKYEIIAKYTNGDSINGSFNDKENAIRVLLNLVS